jgi:hypothetical protein
VTVYIVCEVYVTATGCLNIILSMLFGVCSVWQLTQSAWCCSLYLCTLRQLAIIHTTILLWLLGLILSNAKWTAVLIWDIAEACSQTFTVYAKLILYFLLVVHECYYLQIYRYNEWYTHKGKSKVVPVHN